MYCLLCQFFRWINQVGCWTPINVGIMDLALVVDQSGRFHVVVCFHNGLEQQRL